MNLSFLRNLTRVGLPDEQSTYELISHRFAIYIVENPNLKLLWSRPDNAARTLIVNGSVAMYGNSKLCYEEVNRWQTETLQHNGTGDLIDYESNGYEATCQYEDLKTDAVVHSYRHATIEWESFVLPAGHTLLGYFVYYIEAPTTNVKYSEGKDSCVK